MNCKKIKILMVLDNTGRGGSQTFVMNVCRHIDWNRFQVDIAITRNKRGGYDEEMELLGCRIFNLEHFEVINYRRFLKCWDQFLSSQHYDIIHGHVSSTASIYLRIARKFGCATILHSHSAGYRGGWFEQQVKKIFTLGAAKQADLWFACSDKAAERLFGKRFKTNPRYHYIPNAIDVAKYRFDERVRTQIRKDFGLDNKTFLCGHVGSFSTPKNHQFLIQIFKTIKNIKPDSKLLLVGDGYLRDEIVNRINEAELQDDVIMTGSVSNVNEYMMAMDVMVFPSLFEGLPVTIVEAQAAGLYSIISDVITRDVFLSNLIIYKSLTDSIDDWSNAALSLPGVDRASYNDIIADTYFNIRSSIYELEGLYTSLVDNKK